jgi:hypothetical protein
MCREMVHMLQSLCLRVFCIVAVASPCEAQFELAAHGGVHVDRSDRSDRVVTEGGAEMYAAKGEATALSVRFGHWLRPALGVQLAVSRSSNASWFGHTPVPPPDFANRTTYVSARGVARTSPSEWLQLFVAAGPAIMFHSGRGTNLRTRDTDFGAVLEAGARLHVAGRVGFELAVSNYLYSSTYTAAAGEAGSVFQDDVLIMPGLVISWP